MSENDDPVTDTRPLTDTTRVTGTQVADTSNVTAPAPKKTQNAKAKPKIEKLFVYDQEFDPGEARALRDAYHKGATIVAVADWKGLVATLSRYSTITTLVLFTHSIPGQLLLGDEAPTRENARTRLASTGVTVTGAVVFEGCEIMQDPIATSQIFLAITGPSARLQGYTYYSILDTVTINVPKDSTEQAVQTSLRPHEYYLLPAQPTAKAMAAKPGRYTLHRRWFRKELDRTPAPPLQPGDLPDRSFTPYNKLARRSIGTAEQAKAALEDFSNPVPPAEIVTVTNIGAVAKAK